MKLKFLDVTGTVTCSKNLVESNEFKAIFVPCPCSLMAGETILLVWSP